MESIIDSFNLHFFNFQYIIRPNLIKGDVIMELLAMLLKKSQEQLKNDLYDHLKYLEMDPLYEDGFIYAKGKIPVLLVAHMDTVFPIKPKKIYYNKAQDIIFNPEPTLPSIHSI